MLTPRLLGRRGGRHEQDEETAMNDSLHIAIVGMGPRGLSVFERLVARLTAEPAMARPEVVIHPVDPFEVGAGRIWRTDQPEELLMNTAAVEVSLYSSAPDGGPWRAGAGPSFYEWLSARAEAAGEAEPSPNTYAPRRVYGQYLRSVYDAIAANLPPFVRVEPVRGQAHSLHRNGDGRYRLEITGGRSLVVDKLVLATGHPRVRSGDMDMELLDFASRHRHTRYLRGDSAADMELDGIGSGERVAILGLGLTFYDVSALLTVGRGGRYTTDPDGRLRYEPSGDEPHIVAGSRSGVPLLARGRNQKGALYRYTPRFFTDEAVEAARAQVLAETGHTHLWFRRDVLPLVMRELDYVYYRTHVRVRHGARAEEEFCERYPPAVAGSEGISPLLREYGLDDVPPLDLERMARPFAQAEFPDTASYHAALIALLERDAAEAALGNVDGPLKAALDTLRDTRAVMRAAVEFSSLHPDSHRDEFLNWFNPINTMLSAGPPALRIEQTTALIKAGVLTIVGPRLRIATDEATGEFLLASPQVARSETSARILIDARIPRPNVTADASPLTRQLVESGIASPHVNINARDGSRFVTGALAVTESPFRVVDAAGRPSRDLYAIGIPTEELRWFTQIGNGRPGPLTSFHSDADAVVCDLLATARTRHGASALAGELVS